MQRCPCCNARLSSTPRCPRCGAELDRVLDCENLAKLWLRLAMQALNAGHIYLAVTAGQRSLSFKETQAAKLFRDFLVKHQFQTLYESLAQKHWHHARQNLTCLRALRVDNETLSRFQALIDYLSVESGSICTVDHL